MVILFQVLALAAIFTVRRGKVQRAEERRGRIFFEQNAICHNCRIHPKCPSDGRSSRNLYASKLIFASLYHQISTSSHLHPMHLTSVEHGRHKDSRWLLRKALEKTSSRLSSTPNTSTTFAHDILCEWISHPSHPSTNFDRPKREQKAHQQEHQAQQSSKKKPTRG